MDMEVRTTVGINSGTPFHSRTAALSKTTWWYGWTDYVIPDVFTTIAEELAAVRSAVAMIDMSPLPKIEVTGPDAGRFLDFLSIRKTTANVVGHALYTAWCTHEGKLITDGLVFRLEENRYIVSSDSIFEWFMSNRGAFDVNLRRCTDEYGVLSLQGPKSTVTLNKATGDDWSDFAFCQLRFATIAGCNVMVARQGFTGEIGYELWVARQDGPQVWDAVHASGQEFGIKAAGEFALDLARLEAGMTLASTDYTNAGPDGRSAHVPADPGNLSSPYEIGLGKFVNLDKGDFIGRDALRKEAETGPHRKLIGLEFDWKELVGHYLALGEPPEITPRVRWDAMAIKMQGTTVGRATSLCWSPYLKRGIGFASIEAALAVVGTTVSVDWVDQWGKSIGIVPACLVECPFVSLTRAN